MDIAVLLFLQDLRASSPLWFNKIVVAFSEIGVAAIPVVVVMFIYWGINKKLGTVMIFTFGFGNMMNSLLKNIACVYRPWIRDARIVLAEEAVRTATGYSFPSGHSTLAAGFYSAAARHNSRNKAFAAFLVMVLLACGFSRLWLCAHTPQDVACGLLLGIISMFFSSFFLDRICDGKKMKVAFGIMAFFVLASLLFMDLKPYPVDFDAAGKIIVDPYEMKTDAFKNAGVFIGILTGFLFERMKVNFSDETTVAKKILRFLVGTSVIGTVHLLMKMTLIPVAGLHWGNLFSHMVTFFLISGGIPFLFRKINL